MKNKSDIPPPKDMIFSAASIWKLKDHECVDEICLITEEQLKLLPHGTRLWSINGVGAIVGTSEIDLDTRFGYLAYGFNMDVIPEKQKPVRPPPKTRFTGWGL